MGAGVSLSLPEMGFGECILSLISDPFPWDYDFYVVSVPCTREQVFLCERNFYGLLGPGHIVTPFLIHKENIADGCFLPHRGDARASATLPKTKVC